MDTALSVAPVLTAALALAVLGLSRATHYRRQHAVVSVPRKPSPRAYSPQQRSGILTLLNEPRFVDLAPIQVYATLLGEHRYECSVSSMYRFLAADDQVRERRDQLRHPPRAVPRLVTTGPNQLWSWDITKLHGPAKWQYFYLYVILDVYSRYVVGWLIAPCESDSLASKLIAETCARQKIPREKLTIHADRGSSMKSKAVAFLLADLGVTKTHSRPHVSDDNPYSEAHFKTLKYRPDFPEQFGCIEDARAHCRDFFDWYCNEHHHSGIALHTPYDVHYGLAAQRTTERHKTLLEAFQAHPERFPHGPPKAPLLHVEAWINKPTPTPQDAPLPPPACAPACPPAPLPPPAPLIARTVGTELILQ